MATVPNYYFQSPWIADAARNLATALKPPDPREQLAAQQAKWQFQRAQEMAQYQDEQRASDSAADQALSELALDEPAVNPVTGKVDDKQTGINRRNIASRAYAGGREYVDPTNKLLGVYSPTFESEELLKAISAKTQADVINMRAGNQMDLTQYVQDKIDKRQANTIANNWSMEQYRQTARFALHNASAQQHLAEIQARIAAAHGNPKNINGKMLEDIVYYLDQRVEESGKTLPPGPYNELLTRMAINASATGNVPLAVTQEWEGAGLDPGEGAPDENLNPIQQKLRDWGLTSAPNYLTPKFGERPAAPSQDTGSQYLRERDENRGIHPAIVPPLPAGVPTLSGVVAPGATAGPAPDGKTIPIPVRTPADAAALPPGTLIIDPRGRVGHTKGRGP